MSQLVIWPWWLRVCHWLVAIGVVALWLLTYVLHETGELHRFTGYGLISAIFLRIALSLLISSATTKLKLPSKQQLRLHLHHLKLRQIPVHYGHNPLGFMAVYWLWFCISALAFTGWLSRTDLLWGEDWPVDLHAYLSYLLMASVLLHICAVFLVSKWSKQQLLKQMIDGELHHQQDLT